MKLKVIGSIILIIILALIFSSCAPKTIHPPEEDPAGFFKGLWHGMISFFTLIISIFSDQVRMYDDYNTGTWYDLGFFLGIIIIYGGSSHSVHHHHYHKKSGG